MTAERKPERVEMRMAYEWTCPGCGRDQFVRGIHLEESDEVLQELREDHGIETWDTGIWMYMPTEVTCQHCGSVYWTQHYSEEDDDE